jgi:AraC-like DNA-binding protein
MLERRIDAVETGKFSLKVPRLRGLRLRLPGKPFHATPEFFFQEEGETEFLFPEESFCVRPGETCIVPGGMPHGEDWREECFLNGIVMFQPEGFSVHYGYREGGKRIGPLDRFTFPAHLKIQEYAAEIGLALDGGMEPSAPLVRGLFLALLGRLREGVRGTPLHDPVVHPLLRRCHTLLEMEFARHGLSVEWLAGELGCTPDHLSRLFRRQSGQRLMDYLHRKRIDYAKHLLLHGQFNIAETAWACGFANVSYFNKIFRSLTGMSPGNFRRYREEI